jgi:serine O-acetyltransferase
VLLCRLAYWFHRKRLGPFAKVTSLINFTVFGIEIAARCHIGKGLFFPHTQGTVIGAHSIGENATIYHNVTLGARDLDLAYSDDKRPVVEDDVLIASGAKIVGGVRIGTGARIGANALVLKSVPAGSVARAPLAEILPPAVAS